MEAVKSSASPGSDCCWPEGPVGSSDPSRESELSPLGVAPLRGPLELPCVGEQPASSSSQVSWLERNLWHYLSLTVLQVRNFKVKFFRDRWREESSASNLACQAKVGNRKSCDAEEPSAQEMVLPPDTGFSSVCSKSLMSGWQEHAYNTVSGRGKSRAKSKSPCHCSVCEAVIIKSDKATKVEGQDAILCEGPCQGWLHRRCAGLSKSAFKSSNSTDPFYCPYFRLKAHEAQLLELKTTLCAVTAELSELKDKFSIRGGPSCSSKGDLSANSATIVSISPPVLKAQTYSAPDKKHHLVIYGIHEHEKGTQRHIRSSKDIDSTVSLLSSVHPSITTYSVNDCLRLGKYAENRCRPILVKLNRPIDVSTILANRAKLDQSSKMFIKPHMSLAERQLESILLKERWKLIQSGIPRKHIKLKSDCLIVHNKKYGQVVDSKFTLCSVNGGNLSPASVISHDTNAAVSLDVPVPVSEPSVPNPLNTTGLPTATNNSS